MTSPDRARWDLLSTGSVVADARSRTVAVNVETVHADDMPELLDAMGQALRFLDIDPDSLGEMCQSVSADGKAGLCDLVAGHRGVHEGRSVHGWITWQDDVKVSGFADMGRGGVRP